MDFYLDFEATQFSERVIAIGCTNMGTMNFDILCRPVEDKAKITKFITGLTGITQEQIDAAESTEGAFRYLMRRMQEAAAEENDYGPHFYHAYSDSDKKFLQRSAEDVKDQEVKEFMLKLAESLIDDSKYARQYFHAKTIGLHRALKYFFPDIPDQDHNPLHDAQMLGTLMYQIKHAEPPENCPFVPTIIAEERLANLKVIRHATNRKADATYNTACGMAGKKGGKPSKEKIYNNVAHAVETGEMYSLRLWIKEPISD